MTKLKGLVQGLSEVVCGHKSLGERLAFDKQSVHLSCVDSFLRACVPVRTGGISSWTESLGTRQVLHTNVLRLLQGAETSTPWSKELWLVSRGRLPASASTVNPGHSLSVYRLCFPRWYLGGLTQWFP